MLCHTFGPATSPAVSASLQQAESRLRQLCCVCDAPHPPPVHRVGAFATWRRLLSANIRAPVRRNSIARLPCASMLLPFAPPFRHPDLTNVARRPGASFHFLGPAPTLRARLGRRQTSFVPCSAGVPCSGPSTAAADCEPKRSGYDARIALRVWACAVDSQTAAAKSCLTPQFAGRSTQLRSAAASEPLRWQSAPLLCVPPPANTGDRQG